MIDKNERFLHILYEHRKQLNEHIAKYELPVDPYAKLKAVHEAGKRIGIKCSDGYVYCRPDWSCPEDYYKIIEDDEEATKYFYFNDSVPHEVKVTKCALTGKIKVEVVE